MLSRRMGKMGQAALKLGLTEYLGLELPRQKEGMPGARSGTNFEREI